MNRPTRLVVSGAALFVLPLVVLFDTNTPPGAEGYGAEGYGAEGYGAEGYGAEGYGPQGSSGLLPGGPQTGLVVLVDQGLGMPAGQYALPQGWSLTQDVATDPRTGQPLRNRVEIQGPQGMTMRSTAPLLYGAPGAPGFDAAWQQRAAEALGDVSGVSFGPPRPSPAVEARPSFRRLVETGRASGMQAAGLEAPFRGQRAGQPVEGFVELVRITAPTMPGMGSVTGVVAFGPPGSGPALRAAADQIDAGYQPNPAHQQRVAALGQQHAAAQRGDSGGSTRWIDESMAAHNARMGAMRAQHDAHNSAWQAGQDAQAAQNRRWLNAHLGTADVRDTQTGQTYYGVSGGAGAYWADPVSGAVVGTDRYADNPDPFRYNAASNLDDID